MSQLRDKNHKLISGYCRIESDDTNVIDGIISIIFKYYNYKTAKWSKQYKGKKIKLFEGDSKAMCVDEVGEHSVRANFCIDKGQIVSWELECRTEWQFCNFFGVVSSQVTDFEDCPSTTMSNAYGVDDGRDLIYMGDEANIIDWNKPDFICGTVFILKMVADWTGTQCKLTIHYNGKKLNENHDDYTMLLPELDDGFVWYPCVTPYSKDAYCIIRFVS